MRLNLTACGLEFTNHNYTNYTYSGPIRGILNNVHPRPPLITVQGCHHLCGSGSDYYSWADVSSTITTWVLPVIGLILQAPFESNENFKSILALARWIGNPIASISYVLWNIKIIGKCAMMVDMATPYDELPGENSNFAQMRDSLYILSVMNQYEIRQDLVKHDEIMVAYEKLLRIALFSDELPMRNEAELTVRRQKLARTIRAFRKKGVVPVFVSTLWFLVALAISIDSTFGNRGTNESAHDLALGLLLAFLPIFILSCVVDRNAVAAGRICSKLNRLLATVRDALVDDELRATYGGLIGRGPESFDWIKVLRDKSFNNFFTEFAGQGRIRWHYGVAHPLLCSFEDSFMAEDGRGWLPEDNADRARTFMRDHRDEDHRFIWFDPRMAGQIVSAVCIVCASAGGAFILSYYTPTVGLGCRSGGYMIYVVNTVFLFLVEMLCWGLRTSNLGHRRWVQWIGDHLVKDLVLIALRRRRARRVREWWESSKWTDHVDILLRLIEVGNLGWLVYIVTAQTVGYYVTCDCISSTWAGGGGYTDFEDIDIYHLYGITYYWGTGTALSCAVLVVGLAYIVAEFCSQSHLATEDFRDASEGLKLTRRFKKYTYWLRLLISWDEILLRIWRAVCVRWRRVTGRRPKAFKKTLIWDWKVKRRGAGRTPLRVLDHRRRSSTQPLMDHSQDEGSGDEKIETRAHYREQDRTRDVDRSRDQLPTLQLPPQVHSDNTFLQPPSPSSDISRSSSDYARQGAS